MIRKYKTQREKGSSNNIVVESQNPFNKIHHQRINSLNEEQSEDFTDSDEIKNDTNEKSLSIEDESPEIVKKSYKLETSIDSKQNITNSHQKRKIGNSKFKSSDIYPNKNPVRGKNSDKKLSNDSIDDKIRVNTSGLS